MTDPTLIADLVRAGVDPELVQRVHAALVSTFVHGQSADSPRTQALSQLEKRRERDRVRKAEERAAARVSGISSKANDVEDLPGAASDVVHGQSADNVDARCDDSSFLSSESLPVKQESKKVVARARGSRMEPGAVLTGEYRGHAVVLGADPDAVDAMWAEFVDYWIGVPGHRGVKLDWLATWRNRVRDLAKRKGKPNGQARKSLADAADDLIARAEAREREGPGFGDLDL